MFHKMRRNFLLLNMFLITILMLVSFSVIFALTVNDIYEQINTDLVQIEEDYTRELLSTISSNNDFIYRKDDQNEVDSFYYVADIQPYMQINYTNIDLEESRDDIANINELILESGNEEGRIYYNTKVYYYKFYNSDLLNRIIVMDVTERMMTLNNMAMNLLTLGVVMLVAIFGVSFFFTTKSMKPLERAFKKQKQFISDASHELKTPLAVMRTNMDILSTSIEKDDENYRWVETSKKEIDVMNSLVSNLLDLTKLEESKEINIFQKINLSNIVTEVILTLEPIAFEKLIIIEDDIADDVYIMGSYDEIKRLIVILMDNAIKYCNEEGSIKVSLNKDTLIVSNTGTIISREDATKIFERFYRTNKERDRKSNSFGLGLSIGKAIVDKHGFTIKAYPENEMTNFKISIKSI